LAEIIGRMIRACGADDVDTRSENYVFQMIADMP
jgi:hypothetical protein